ncbi:MAG: DUF58 domain-containing protein [Candidatus Dormibacteraceae bacterium]
MARAVIAAGLGLLLLLSYLTGIRIAFAFTYAIVMLVVLAWAWPRLAARGIGIQRSLQAGRPAVGENFMELIEVTKSGPVPAPWVEVMDLSHIHGYQAGRIISVGRRPVSWTARGVYRRRGWQTFGPTVLRVGEPFGLFTREVRTGGRSQVLVYPRIRPLPEVLLPTTQHVGEATRYGAWADYPPETGGVREYAPGDAYGRIHWLLSAKQDRLMSKTFEQPLTTDLWIALDLQRQVHQGDGEESTAEYAISLAASLVMQVRERGRLVGLMANDRRGTVLEPHRMERDETALLDYLAIAEPDGDLPLARALAWDRIRRVPHRAFAVITPSSDPSWMGAVQGARQRGTALIAFYLDSASFGAPIQPLTFDLGSDVDLYVIRQGDDLSRMMRSRDAARLL